MVVQLTPVITSAVKRILTDSVKAVLPRRPQDILAPINLPQFLADPAPGTALGDFQHRAGRAACDRWARTDRSGILPGQDLAMRSLCAPYLGSGLPDSPTSGPPFEGGQCLDISYSVRFSYDDNQGVRQSIDSITSGAILGTYSEPGNFGATRIGYETKGSDGVTRRFLQFTRTAEGTGSPAIVILGRQDGLPDNCGNPPEEFDSGEPNPTPDPNPGPVGGPPGYPFPGVDITINPTGDVVVDFGDGEPPEVIDPSADDDGGGGAGGGGTGDPPPGDVGEAADPQDADGDGNASGCAPEGSILVGLKIDFVVIPRGAREFAAGVYRAVCYAYLGTIEGLDLDPAGAVMRSGQFIFSERENLTCWEVRANNGWSLSVTPYYRALEQEE